MFLSGIVFSIGINRTIALFSRYGHGDTNVLIKYYLYLNVHNVYRMDRIRGTICFFLGIILVTLRWGLLGLLLEGFGFLNLFGNFLPYVVMIGRQVPGLSVLLNFPFVSQAADYLAGTSVATTGVATPSNSYSYDESRYEV